MVDPEVPVECSGRNQNSTTQKVVNKDFKISEKNKYRHHESHDLSLGPSAVVYLLNFSFPGQKMEIKIYIFMILKLLITRNNSFYDHRW